MIQPIIKNVRPIPFQLKKAKKRESGKKMGLRIISQSMVLNNKGALNIGNTVNIINNMLSLILIKNSITGVVKEESQPKAKTSIANKRKKNKN